MVEGLGFRVRVVEGLGVPYWELFWCLWEGMEPEVRCRQVACRPGHHRSGCCAGALHTSRFMVLTNQLQLYL